PEPSPCSRARGRTCVSANGWEARREPRIRRRPRGLRPARGLPRVRADQAGAVLAMTLIGWVQIAAFFLVVLALTKPAGAWMFRVFEGTPPLPRLARLFFRPCALKGEHEQRWPESALPLLAFRAAGVLVTYA